MAPSSVELPDLDALDSNGLKSLILRNHALLLETSAELKSKQSELESHQNEIERLKLFIAKLQRMQFGPSSEKVARHIDQLVLQLEELENSQDDSTCSYSPERSSFITASTKGPASGLAPRSRNNFAERNGLSGLRRDAETSG